MEDGTMSVTYRYRLRTNVVCLEPIIIPAENDMEIDKLLIIPVIRQYNQEAEENEESKPHTH